MFKSKTKNLFKVKLSLKVLGFCEVLELKKKSRDCQKAQELVLRDILSISKDTEYGKKYHFQEILNFSNERSLGDYYEELVPVNQYEDIRPYIEKHKSGQENILFPGKPKFYDTTTSSANEIKWIPITEKYYNDVYTRMSPTWLYSFFAINRHIFEGAILFNLPKSTEGVLPDGTPYGSLAAISQSESPSFIKAMFSSTPEVFLIEDYKARYYAIMRIGIEQNVHIIASGSPSALSQMINNADEFLDEYIKDIEHGTLSELVHIPEDTRAIIQSYLKPNPKRALVLSKLKKKYGRLLPKHYWPNLQVLNVWKSGNSAVQLKKIKGAFPETCLFTEFGFFMPECRPGIILDPNSDSTVIFPHKNYFEFVREKDLDLLKPKFFRLHELRIGQRYSIFVTTYSGLYRYNMNDLVEVRGFYEQTPKVSFVKKTNGIVSILGENLNENQFINAVGQVEKEFSKKLEFFVGFADVEKSLYYFYFEFVEQNIEESFLNRFVSRVDFVLKSNNIEYAEMRRSNRLAAPKGHLLKRHAFEVFKSRAIDKGLYDNKFKLSFLMQDEVHHEIFKKIAKRFFLKI